MLAQPYVGVVFPAHVDLSEYILKTSMVAVFVDVSDRSSGGEDGAAMENPDAYPSLGAT